MAELTLWHVPQSRSMRALWLLHEIGADFRVETLDFFDGTMRQPPYAAITPVGRVPALHEMPVGCRFQNRCPLAADVCRQNQPPYLL